MKKFLFVVAVLFVSGYFLKNWFSSGQMDEYLREHADPAWTPRIVYCISQASYWSNKYETARRYLRWLADEYPSHPDIADVRWQLGQTYEELKRRDLAVEQYAILKDSFSATAIGQTAANRYMNLVNLR